MSRFQARTTHVGDRLGSLRADLDSLQRDIKGLAAGAGEAANDHAHTTLRAAENVAERAFRLAEDSTAHMVDDVESWTNGNLDSARQSIRARPLSSLAFTLGIGAILGAIFLRR
jgi:ElaB/YqjD/DUF883 family membrane-anchored ribosome-binding protein